MLVEDNADDDLLAPRAFKKNNVVNPIIVARDGQMAADYLFDPANKLPAFILLDLKLPKVSGMELLARRRDDARVKLVPVIVMTSSMDEPDLRVAYGLGHQQLRLQVAGAGQVCL